MVRATSTTPRPNKCLVQFPCNLPILNIIFIEKSLQWDKFTYKEERKSTLLQFLSESARLTHSCQCCGGAFFSSAFCLSIFCSGVLFFVSIAGHLHLQKEFLCIHQSTAILYQVECLLCLVQDPILIYPNARPPKYPYFITKFTSNKIIDQPLCEIHVSKSA